MKNPFRKLVKGNRKYAVLAFGLIFIILVGTKLLTIVQNPTAADVNYTKTWKDSSGVAISDITTATINGKVTCQLQIGPPCVREAETVGIRDMTGAYPITVPFYIKTVTLEIYQKVEDSYSTSAYQTITATSDNSSYSGVVKQWGDDWVKSWLYTAAIPPADPPFTAMNWTLVFDTLGIPNGDYKLVMRATWAWTPGALLTTSLPYQISSTPPSLSSSGGSSIIFSLFMSFRDGTGTGNGDNGQIITYAAVGIVVLGVAVIVIKKPWRRSR